MTVLRGVAALVVLIAASTASTARAARGPVPASLTAAESGAEDIVDAALAHDRGGVVSIAATLRSTARGEAAALRRDGVPARLVTQLEQRADRLASLAGSGPYVQILLAANAVSELMSDLYARFAGSVPPALQALDYLDREAQFRSLAGQPARVAAAVEELGHVWLRVRPKVLAAGGSSEADAYARHVAALKGIDPASARKVQAEAVHGLELVDGIERVFG